MAGGIYRFNKAMSQTERERHETQPLRPKKERRHLVQVELERDLESHSEKHEKCIHLYEVY
jgi:hypothetical protein